MGEISPVGEQWASLIVACNGWSFRANQRYTGPWTTAEGPKKTRFPVLFLSLDADAVKMTKDYAILLTQQGSAHPSLCTYKNIRDYFIDGKVPANGTHCTPEPGFIYPTNDTTSKRVTLNKREVKLIGVLKKLGQARSAFTPDVFHM